MIFPSASPQGMDSYASRPQGSLSNHDDAEDNAWQKMNLYITSEIRDCLELLGMPMALQTCYIYICNNGGQFQMDRNMKN